MLLAFALLTTAANASDVRGSVDALKVGTLVKSAFATHRGAIVQVATAVFPRAQVTLRVVDFPHGGPAGRTVLASLQPDGVAAITGGYFNGAFRPYGLLELDGVVTQPVSAQLSGIVGSSRAGDPEILPARDIDTAALRDAVQAGPFLVDPGGRNGIHRDDAQRAIRAFVLVNDTSIAVGISSRCTLYELAGGMVDSPTSFGVERIERALNLSGDGSAGFAVRFPDNSVDTVAESIRVRTVLQIAPRAPAP